MPQWAYCGGEQTRFDKILERAKRVTRPTCGKTTSISSSNFKIYSKHALLQ